MNRKYIVKVSVALVVGIAIFLIWKNSFSLPSSLVLQVPFSTQAPTDKWDRNEDCEETSIMMANAFLTGTTENVVPSGAASEAINNLKKWEQANLGYNADTGAAATTRMAEGAFGLKVQQIKNFSEQDLKKKLAQKHPILLPINARLLKNPKYQDSGPFYHMVVLRGYTDQGFIVNDPGISEGNGNVYSFEVLKNASADWNQTTKSMESDRKTALVLSK